MRFIGGHAQKGGAFIALLDAGLEIRIWSVALRHHRDWGAGDLGKCKQLLLWCSSGCVAFLWERGEINSRSAPENAHENAFEDKEHGTNAANGQPSEAPARN
eukprot:366134-Chlamydomonas_euryale.AAC.6